MTYKNFSRNIGTVRDDTEVADFARWIFITVGIVTIVKYIVKSITVIVLVLGKRRKKN